MKRIAASLALFSAIPFTSGATVSSCLKKVSNDIGVTSALEGNLGNVDDSDDMVKLKAAETDGVKIRLSNI